MQLHALLLYIVPIACVKAGSMTDVYRELHGLPAWFTLERENVQKVAQYTRISVRYVVAAILGRLGDH